MNEATPIEELAKAELSTPNDKEAYEKLQIIKQDVEQAIAEWLTSKGLTATTIKHIWPSPDFNEYEIREGAAPPDLDRPVYLRGVQLNVCQFRLPGVVIKIKESQEEKYFRLRRNPKKGEMEAMLKSLSRSGEANELRKDPQPGPSTNSGAVL